MTVPPKRLRIMPVDCCEHILAALRGAVGAQLLLAESEKSADFGSDPTSDVIVVGVAEYPIRRLFISQIRRLYPDLVILILRREQRSDSFAKQTIRGEFVLSDQNFGNDCELVNSLRRVMPFPSCSHISSGEDHDRVRELLRVFEKRYDDPKLSLNKVAREMGISPKRLSVILNGHVGVSFRQMLRQLRVEEAKRMLLSRQFSVKEVASRVGFSDSHHFSRTFKELTGQNAGEYREQSRVLN